MGIDLSIEAIVKEGFFEIRKCYYDEQLEAVNLCNYVKSILNIYFDRIYLMITT